jgi:hypothetical protein
MPLFAEMDTQAWIVVGGTLIGSLCTGVGGIVALILVHRATRENNRLAAEKAERERLAAAELIQREAEKAEREKERALKVEEVRLEMVRTTLKLEEARLEQAKLALDVKTTLHDSTVTQEQKFDHLAKQMNGLKDELVQSVKAAAFAAGQKEQKEADGAKP